MYILYNPQGNTEGHSQQYASNIVNGLISAGFFVNMVTSKDFDSSKIVDHTHFKAHYTPIEDTRSVKKDDRSLMGRLVYGFLILKNNFKSFRTLTKIIKKSEFSHLSIIGGDTLSNLMYLFFSFGLDKSKCSITIHNADYDLSLYQNDLVRYSFKLISKLFLKFLIKGRLVIFTHGEIMCKNLALQLNCPLDRIDFYRVPAVSYGVTKVGNRVMSAPVRLLFLGVVRFDKGFDILCSCLAQLEPTIKFELIVAGSSAQVGDKYINDLIVQYNLESKTSLELRYLTDLELEQLIIGADITVLPYRKTFLAKSVVMSDTARLGTPAIATKESQNGYDVDTFGVGWSFSSEDQGDLVRVLTLAISDIVANNCDFGFSEYIDAHLPETVGIQIKSAMENSNA